MMPTGIVTAYRLSDVLEHFLFVKSLEEGKEPFKKRKLVFSKTKYIITQHLDENKKY